MIPIPLLGGQSLGHTVLTLVVALIPALLAWWNDRRLLSKGDDPALPELLANRRRFNIRSIAVAVALMIVFGQSAAEWGIPLLIVLLIAAAYPLRKGVLGETWGFGAYMWHTLASVAGGFGFWIALCFAPSIVNKIVTLVGMTPWWRVTLLAMGVAAVLFAWEAWYPHIWLWTHAAERLTSPALTPKFDEIVRRAGTIVPDVYRVGPKGSRFVNAVALPSVTRPSVAMGTALLDLLEPDETAAIFAHEVAHFDHFTPRRVRRTQLINRVLIVIGVGLPLLMAFANIRSAPWIGLVWPILVLVAVGRRAAKSQQHETESDLRAAALSGDPEALVRGLVKLHLHARIPRRYAVDIERAASHPSLVRRIQAIRAGGAAAIEQLGTATVVRSTREGSWVVLDDSRSYWLDGVPGGTEPQLTALRDAASSYRAVNYQDLAELRVAAAGDTRTLTARTRAGDSWNVPISPHDVARAQRTLDVVDLRLGKPGPAPARAAPKIIAVAAFAVTFLAGQAGVVLAPILVAMSKPTAAALAALGAMSIVRAALGALEGSSWFDEDLVRIGLAAMAVVGVVAIYTAVRLIRAGEGKAYQRLTIGVLVGVAVLMGVGVVMQTVRMPSMPLLGSPMLSGFGTSLFGLAAALFTMRARWARPAGYAGMVAAAMFVTLGVDRRAVVLRHALTEVSASATPGPETELGSAASQLRVSPDGSRFLAIRTPTDFRPGVARRPMLVTGRVGGSAREIAATDAEFVDDGRLLIVDARDNVVELRLEAVDGGVPPLWADTLLIAALSDPRVILDREAGTWALVGTDADSDRTAVFAGKIGEKGAARRSAIPDTIPMSGEPVVFDQGATLIVPSYKNVLNSVPAMSLWSVPFFGFDMPAMELWRIHGDSVKALAPLRGMANCGEPLRGVAACSVQRMNSASLVSVSSSGVVVEIAQLSSNVLRAVTLGPGLQAASSTFEKGAVVVDLAARRLTRIQLPPNTGFASEVRAGSGWIVTLGYGSNQRSVVRGYRVNSK